MLLNVAILMALGQAGGDAAGGVDAIPTAADALAAAHADLARQPTELRPSLRYISLHHLAAKERTEAAVVLAGHCNQLSRARTIEKPRPVGPDAMLLRVNLTEYKWPVDVWEQLADPYFTVFTETEYIEYEDWPGGIHKSDGKHYGPGKFKHTRMRKQQALAPWLSDGPDAKAMLADVVAWTGSKIPVTRGDWFLNTTAAAVDRKPNYYDFIGAKDRATFEEGGGFDRKLFEKFRLPLREAIAISGVTLQPRALVFFDSAGGGYTFSVDFKSATGDKNPLKNLGKGIEGQGDAFEAFILGPNGFWRTALYDAKGKLQDFAPPDIAGDHASKSNDKRVHVNVSCTRCHVKGGMQDVDAWVRNLINPPLELRTSDYEKYVEAREEYLSDLSEFIDRTRGIYERAVKRATGLDSTKYAAVYARAFESYEDRKVTAEIAARDVGIDVKEFRRRLLLSIKAGYPVSPVASAFVHEGARAKAIGIRQHEEIIPELYLITRGTMVAPKK